MKIIETKNIATYDESVEDLAFAHLKYNANEKAYEAKLIPKATYEFARNELQKDIDSLSDTCYNVPKFEAEA
jgi:maleate cis-trans isomerase